VSWQCESHRRNPEHIGFGSATRKNVEKQFISHEHSKGDGAGKHSPGPAGYGPGRPSVGIQHESKKVRFYTLRAPTQREGCPPCTHYARTFTSHHRVLEQSNGFWWLFC